jgi:hypothetical protein
MRGFLVLTRTKPKTQVLKENAASAADFATALAKDTKFRKELLSALKHGTVARNRAARRIGFVPTVRHVTSDDKLRQELDAVKKSLEKAWTRIEKKRSHKLRNTLLVVGLGGIAAAITKGRSHSAD